MVVFQGQHLLNPPEKLGFRIVEEPQMVLFSCSSVKAQDWASDFHRTPFAEIIL